jgi:T5SS/PEP-CTERM-associated repeat protein/autotransporter-associated beta strand protein
MARLSRPHRSPGVVAKSGRWQAGRGYLLGTTAIAGVIAALSASPALANDWTGAVSSDWFTAGNWSGGVPTIADPSVFVFIENNGVPNAPVVGSPGAFALNLIVGNVNGPGSLSVLNGGTLHTLTSSISGFSNGAAVVSGAGSAWITDGSFSVGAVGTGTLSVANSGAVSSQGLFVGQFGAGSVIIGGGGTVTADSVTLAQRSGSTGTLAIGAASGQAAAAPGTLNAPSVLFGTGTGTLVFNHTSSNYTFAPTISGPGSVRVEAGTTIFTAANSYSNGTSIAGGTLEVSGPNGGISSGNDVSVGTLAGSTGTFNVTNGGKVTDGNGLLGNVAGATGNATVTGAGSNWTSTAFFAVGNTGNGSLTIENGGTVIGNTASYIAYGAGTTGSVTVTGANSQFVGNSSIAVGHQGTGSLLVEAGGVARAVNGFVGVFGSGAAIVTGAGSAWNTDVNLSLGGNSQGTLTVADGGSVSVGDTLLIAVNAGSTGTLNIGAASGQAAAAAGAIITPSVVFGAGTGKIVFNHTDTGYVFASDVSGAGSIRTEAGTTIFTGTSTYSGGTTLAGGTLQLGDGGTTGSITGNVTDDATLVFNRSNAYGFGGVISGSGTVQQNGTGTTTLSGTNGYLGGTGLNAGTLSIAADTNLGNAAGALSFNGGVMQVTGTAFTSTARTINWGSNGGGFDIADANNTFTVNQTIGSGGALTKLGAGSLVLTAANSYAGGTTIAAGTLQLGSGGTTGSITGDVTNNGSVAFNRSNTYQFDGVISGAGAMRQIGSGTTVLTGNNAYSGGTTISAGILQLGNGGASGSIVGDVLDNATLAINRSDIVALTANISGTGAFQQLGTGTTILAGINNYAGGTTIAGGTLRVENNAALGTGAVTTTGSVLDYANGITLANPIQIDSNHTQLQVLAGTAAQTGVISELNGPRPLEKIGAGGLILTAVNSYTGATTVTGGTLEVDGSIASSLLTTVNANATLTGTGTVGNTAIASGGTFAPGSGTPGSSISVTGSLVFASGAAYMVQINPTTSSLAHVTGSATLNGTVKATFAAGSYIAKLYTILTTTTGRTGTFSSLVNTGMPASISDTLSYDADNAYLNVTLNFAIPGGLNVNQQNVGNTLTNFFNAAGGIPAAFANLSPAGLTQASGESATGTQRTTFNAMTQFMGVMTDPFITGRNNDASTGGNATGYADEAIAYAKRNPNDALAAIFSNAQPRVTPFEARWSTWVAGFGGSQTTDGNATVGSSTATSRIFGTAVGADYRFSPFTIAGFALAGGGTSFSVANGGSGRSDLFQAGAFVRHDVGAAYVSAALAYGWQDVTTDRTVTSAGLDQLRARFNANAYSGRVESGYRFVTPAFGGLGITPYAAAQFTTFNLPAYAEGVLSGASTFALSYGSQSVTDTRSELGFRADKSFAMQTAILTLRGRAAWSHDYNPNSAIAATFQALPGASFVVNGAAQARDAALTTASAEVKWNSRWSTAATFEGEFSNVTRSYAGKGVVRYEW